MGTDIHQKPAARILLVLIVAFYLAVTGLLNLGSAHAAAATFDAATARVDITPTTLGFSSYLRGGFASNSLTPVTSGSQLSATGLLIIDSNNEKWVIVSADILAFPDSVVSELRTIAQTEYAIDPEHLLLVATHTHNGPILRDQPNLFTTYDIAPGSANDTLVNDYTNEFISTIDDLLLDLTTAQTTEASAKHSYEVSNFGYNRASNNTSANSPHRQSVEDGTIPVLTIRSESSDEILAVLYSYAAHAVTAPTNTWDPDYPGAANQLLESQLDDNNPEVKALFLPATGGDQDPEASMSTIATELSNKVLSAITNTTGTGTQAVLEPVEANATNIELPLDITADLGTTMRTRYANVASGSGNFSLLNHASLMVDEIDLNTARESMGVSATTWQFGTNTGDKPLALIALAGEPTVDIGAGFESLLDDDYRTWTLGYSNGHPGYIPSDELLRRGDNCPTSGCFYWSYESSWETIESGQKYPATESAITYNDGLIAPLAIGADNKICEEVTELLLGSSLDCTGFTSGRLRNHAAFSSSGPGIAAWTDSAGAPHIDIFVLKTDSCIAHRSWQGTQAGSMAGSWSQWDTATICGGIVGEISAEAWLDPNEDVHFELGVQTSDGKLFHGRCFGDSNGCMGKTWSWNQIASTSDAFLEPPELAVWKQQNGYPRIEAYSVSGSSKCASQRSWTSTDTYGTGSWGSWTSNPGCGGITHPMAAASWRPSTTSVEHQVFAVTSNGSLYSRQCSGNDTGCSWGSWVQLSTPGGTTVVDAPTYTTSQTSLGQRHDLFVRASTGCIWHAQWLGTTPTSPSWSQLTGCGLHSRIGAASWVDTIGRSRTNLIGMDSITGLTWFNQRIARTANSTNTWVGWEDIADPSYSVTNP
jgi:neutral ceramidase